MKHAVNNSNPSGRYGLWNFILLLLCLISLASCNSGTPSSSSSTAPVITSFGIGSTVTTPSGTSIALTMPYGTNARSLIATFVTTGVSTTVNGLPQTSGVTANDFSSPVTYVVTGANGATTNYTVTVSVATQSSKSITSYSLAGQVSSTINQSTMAISVVMPVGTSLSTSLVATYTATASRVTVGGLPQISGTTANVFSSPVQYVVTATDGTTATYTVTVTTAASNASVMSAFAINGTSGVIRGTTITVSLPFGVNLNNPLVTNFTVSSGATVTESGVIQESGTSTQVFAPSNVTPLQYVVTSADGTSSTTYYVTATAALGSANTMRSYALNVTNPISGVTAEVRGVITGNNITVVVPSGTNLSTALSANFSTTGNGSESVTINNVPQVSGTTTNSFATAATTPIVYKVVSADGTATANYYVYVSVAAATSASITRFSINGSVGVITGNNIAVTVPYGTSLTSLVPFFTTNVGNANVTVSGVTQTSGTTSNNFTTSLIYAVTAGNGTSIQYYYVTVTPATNTQNTITSFSVNGIPGTINNTNNTITVALPFGSNAADAVATFVTTGTTVTAGAPSASPSTYAIQSSGITSNNFVTNPTESYVVTSSSGATNTYAVTVSISPNTAKAFTAFSINGVPGVIAGTTITESLPFGTPLTTMISNFTITGESATVGGLIRTSGASIESVTTAPATITYTVYDGTGATVAYTVNITVASSFAANDLTFNMGSSSTTMGTVTFSTVASPAAVFACNVGVNSLGFNTLSGCVNTGATALSSPFGITFNATGTLAYIVNSNSTVTACNVAGKVFSNCALINAGVALSGASSAYRITLNPTASLAFLSSTGNSTVVSCSIIESTTPSAVTFNNCGNSGATGLSTPRALNYNTTLSGSSNIPYMLVSNQGGSNAVSACLISTGTLTSCTGIGITPFIATIGMALNGTMLYAANFGYTGTTTTPTAITACNLTYNSASSTQPIAASGCVTSGFTVSGSAAASLTPLVLAMIPNTNGTGIFLTNSAGNIYACNVNGLYVNGCTLTGTP